MHDGNDMLNRKRFLCQSSEQGSLLPTYPSDLVAEDHPARLLSEIVDALDLSVLYGKYSQEGGKSYHPKSLLRILFYGYTNGNRSSRKISQACRESFVYMYLSGGIYPDFRTLSEFRKNNFDTLSYFFQQIVQICYRLGMISFGTLSLDGTKIKANASNRRIAKKERLETALQRIEKDITEMIEEAESIDSQEDAKFGASKSGEELPEKIKKATERKNKIQSLLNDLKNDNRSTMSLTDKESRFMKSHGRLELSYNAQCITENQVILVYDVNNLEADKEQLVAMVNHCESMAASITQKHQNPLENSKLLADSGYDSGQNISHLINCKMDGYIANQMQSVYEQEKSGTIDARPFSKDKFTYHTEGDYYECPTGEKLYPAEKRTETLKSYTREIVRYQCQTCHQCRHQGECVKSKTGHRSVKRYMDYDSKRLAMDEKLFAPLGKEIYKKRSTDVEPVFGHLKSTIFKHGALLVRGMAKARGEFGLACIVHNLKKIVHYIKMMLDIKNVLLMSYKVRKFA